MSKAGSPELVSTDQVVAQPFFDVVLRGDGIVWLRRTTQVYSSITDVHRAYDQ